MKRKIIRNTGFYAMGSPLDLLVDGQKVARINHQETVELNLNSDNRLSVRFSILKSKEIALADLHAETPIRNKNESATDFFLCAVLYWSVSNDRVFNSQWTVVHYPFGYLSLFSRLSMFRSLL